jgi:hypothetical protein
MSFGVVVRDVCEAEEGAGVAMAPKATLKN